MSDHHDTWVGVFGKTVTLLSAWWGTIKLADVQGVVAIISGLIVAGYAATQWYVLWRDKIRGRK